MRGADVLALLSGDLRPEMVEALRRCRRALKTVCLTNNFRRMDPTSEGPPAAPGSDARSALQVEAAVGFQLRAPAMPSGPGAQSS